MENHEKKFAELWTTLNEGIPKQIVCQWQERICSKYRESQRYYHTLQHVMEMENQKDKHCPQLRCAKLVDYAIIFHDVIYDPQRQDNEEKSADLFGEFASEIQMDDTDRQLVINWILLTKTHSTPEHKVESQDVGDKHYFIDLDMAILGSLPQVYEEYAQKIRREYSHISHGEYCSRRAKLLEIFLQTPRIYATTTFHQLYEAQARNNISKEIIHLKAAASNAENSLDV